jgi:serine protease Do
MSLQTDGPAHKSDLKTNDVITAVAGKAVSTPQDLRGEIRGKKIGEPVTLDVVRNGKAMQVKVKPAEWAEAPALPALVQTNPTRQGERSGLGLTIHTLTREVAKQFGADMIDGVIVVGVDRGTLASRQGIRPGDIITAVNQKAVANPKQFREALKIASLSKGIVLNIVSGKTAHFEILKSGDE